MAIPEVQFDYLVRNSLMRALFYFYLLAIIVFVPTSTQEYSYYSMPVKSGDSDPETHVEEVNFVSEYNDTESASTALATVYPIANLTGAVDTAPKDIRVACLNTTHETVVEIFNSTNALMSNLYVNAEVKNRSTPSNCTIVLFYARWCPFSAKAAPHFNALPRVFPALKTSAIDATLHTSVNTFFGILSVPSVMLFRNGKLVAKFNETTCSLAKFVDFVTSVTDLQVAEKVNVTSHDFHGPLLSTPVKELDLYLYLSWVFIGICFVNYARKLRLFKKSIEFVVVTWREAEAQREHQD